MALSKDDLKKIGQVMDERLIKFSQEVTELAMEGMISGLRGELIEKIDGLETKMETKIDNLDTRLSNQISKLERKLDKVTDHHAERLDDHEVRLQVLEG